jgi:hypothetical protein
MNLYDNVILLSDQHLNEGARPGMIGYILEEYSDGMFEVEFSDPDTGETIALIALWKLEFKITD